MRTLFLNLIVTISVFTGYSQTNQELQKMADADQEERLSGTNWEIINKNDSIRLAKATQLFNNGALKTAKDHYNAGIIFQHGNDTIASKMAVESFKKATEMDSTLNRWWYAAAVDRDLMRREEPQIYGTQYIGDGSGKQKQYKMDTTKVTDKERIYYSVPTLAQQKKNERIMNLKKVFFYYTETKSIDKTIDLVKIEFKKGKESEYYIAESDLNNFGSVHDKKYNSLKFSKL